MFTKYASVCLFALVLAGCQPATVGETQKGASQWKQNLEARNVKLNSNAKNRFAALSDEAGFAAWAVAGHIFERCDGMKVSKIAAEFARPTFNRAAVFKGKEKVAAAYETAKASFAAKYGKDLVSKSNHCDAAKREIREETAVSFFFDTTSNGS